MDRIYLSWVCRNTNCLSPRFWSHVLWSYVKWFISIQATGETFNLCQNFFEIPNLFSEFLHWIKYCRVFLCKYSWKRKVFLRITATFKENRSFYFNFIVLCVVLLINKFAHISLLASSFACKLYYLFASLYNLAVSSFDKPRFEVKRSGFFICRLFSKMVYRSNGAYL
jgi:hypothetical protein